MKLKFNLLIIIAIISAVSSGCYSNYSNIENSQSSISSNVVTTSSNNVPLSVTYTAYKEHYRFVSKKSPLLWMPDGSSPKVCDLSNSLVEVLFAGYTTEDNVWLFVSFKTYDTPTNNRGWIRESNTEKYTKQNKKLVKDIIVPKGTLGVDKNKNNVPTIDEPGMIEKREDGKVLIMFAGGNEVWYYEKDIKYPPIQD